MEKSLKCYHSSHALSVARTRKMAAHSEHIEAYHKVGAYFILVALDLLDRGRGKQRPSQLLAIFRGIDWEYIPQSPEAIFPIACQLVYGGEIPAYDLSPHFLFPTLYGQ